MQASTCHTIGYLRLIGMKLNNRKASIKKELKHRERCCRITQSEVINSYNFGDMAHKFLLATTVIDQL